MKLEFEIKTIPSFDQRKHFLAYLEGRVTIFLDDLLFFDEEGILLLELGKEMHDWLRLKNMNNPLDFKYETMDNDEPILSINHVKDDYYHLSSIWQKNQTTDLISGDKIVGVFQAYLFELGNQLKLKCDFDLNAFLSNNEQKN